jgi:hypothetical protein
LCEQAVVGGDELRVTRFDGTRPNVDFVPKLIVFNHRPQELTQIDCARE